MKVMVIVLVFYFCVINYHKCNSLGHVNLLLTSLWAINLAWLRWVLCHLRVSSGWKQTFGWDGAVLLNSLGKNLLSSLFRLLAKSSSLWVKVGGPLFSSPLSAGGSLSSRPQVLLLTCVTPSSRQQQCVKSPYTLTLWLPVLVWQNLLLSKGSSDWVRSTHTVSYFQINWLGVSTIRAISSQQYLDLCLAENQRTGILGRAPVEFHLPCWSMISDVNWWLNFLTSLCIYKETAEAQFGGRA